MLKVVEEGGADCGCCLAIAIHEATEVQERHLVAFCQSEFPLDHKQRLKTAIELRLPVRLTYGLPSFPKTTPFGSAFFLSSSFTSIPFGLPSVVEILEVVFEMSEKNLSMLSDSR